MRYGIYGGSFDPIHLGHLIAAQEALEQAGLDRVGFLPAALAPLRANRPQVEADQRLRMIELALQGHEDRFEILTDEVDKGGLSYSIDTALALQERWPERKLFWIIGGDQLALLPRWHRIGELLNFMEFIVLERPGSPKTIPASLPADKIHCYVGHPVDISSTDIRRRSRAGKSVEFFLPHRVHEYILRNNPYGQ